MEGEVGRKCLAVVVPVYKDWPSFWRLMDELDVAGEGRSLEVFAVNDGPAHPSDFDHHSRSFHSIVRIRIVELSCNLGHQRAIAVGLSKVHNERHRYDAVVVMDADGEDRPGDVPALLQRFEVEQNSIVFAHRAVRSEELRFQACYALYRLAFRLLTGRSINFGNFCLIPLPVLDRLIYSAEVWNHLAASILRLGLSFTSVPTARGRRYDGRSHMGFISLLLHGLSAISVYSETVLVRVLVLAAVLISATLIGICAVVAIKFLSSLAIPGWATNATGLLLVILCQLLSFSFGALFLVLADRSRPLVVPALDCGRYIRETTVAWCREKTVAN